MKLEKIDDGEATVQTAIGYARRKKGDKIMLKDFFKLEFIKNFTDHESEIRVIYCDDFEAQRTESGALFYVCRFSDGSQKTICANQFDDHHVVLLYREEKSPE